MPSESVRSSAGVLQEVTYIPGYITLCTMAPVGLSAVTVVPVVDAGLGLPIPQADLHAA